MEEKLVDKLNLHYPDTMSYVRYPSVSSGWYSIVDYVSNKVTKLSKEHGVKVYFTDIKSKFGTIRMYIGLDPEDYDHPVYKLASNEVDKVSHHVFYVCAMCGKYLGKDTSGLPSWGVRKCEPECATKMDSKLTSWYDLVSDKSKKYADDLDIKYICAQYNEWAVKNSIEDLQILIENRDKLNEVSMTYIVELWGQNCKDSALVKKLLIPILRSPERVLVEGAIYGLVNYHQDSEVKSEIRKLISHESKAIREIAESIITQHLTVFK